MPVTCGANNCLRIRRLLSFASLVVLLPLVTLYLWAAQTGIAMAPSKIFGMLAAATSLGQIASGQTSGDLRMNHIQVVGTHNSYHREINFAERSAFESIVSSPQNLYYSHSSLADQLVHQQVRSLEIDLHSDVLGGLYDDPLIWRLSNLTAGPNGTAPFYDPQFYKPGLKVFHMTDMDTNAVCHTFVECLTQLKDWSDAHPNHLPILIDLELKCDADYCLRGGVCAEEAVSWTLPQILTVDHEIRSVLSPARLVTPDDVRQPGLTLEQSVLTHGWPTLDAAKGKFMFYFDQDPTNDKPCTIVRTLYTQGGHESLQNRTVFTNSVEGAPDAAFLKRNDPTGASQSEIQRLVKKGYIVRTRADTPIETLIDRDWSMYNASWPSGAQIVSTDWPAYGMAARYDRDYAVQLPDGKVARCNPVSAPSWCRDDMLVDD